MDVMCITISSTEIITFLIPLHGMENATCRLDTVSMV